MLRCSTHSQLAAMRPAGHQNADGNRDHEDHHQHQLDQPLSSQELSAPITLVRDATGILVRYAQSCKNLRRSPPKSRRLPRPAAWPMSPRHSPSTCTPMAMTCGCSCRCTPPSIATASRLTPAPRLTELTISIGAHRYQYSVFTAALPGSQAQVYLSTVRRCTRARPSTRRAPDEHLRFLALTRIAIECCQHLGWSPQILHCHDWHAGFGPLLLRALYSWDRLFADTRTVLTIHNIGYQGEFPAAAVADLGLGDNAYLLHQDDLRAGRINALKHGCMYADAITTVSPTYAAEIRTAEYGMGLEDILRSRARRAGRHPERRGLRGLGSAQRPSPEHPLRRHAAAGEGRAQRAVPERAWACRPAPGTALAGPVTRLATQKGIELVLGALPQLLAAARPGVCRTGRGRAPLRAGACGIWPRPGPDASPSTRATARSWRIGSRPPATCSSCPASTSRAD